MKIINLLAFTALATAALSGCGSSRDGKKTDTPPAVTPAPASEDGTARQPTADGNEVFGAAEGVLSKDGAFLVKLEWLTPLASEAFLRAKLTFADAARHAPATVGSVAFEPWMPNMGHGTAMDDQTITPSPDAANIFSVDDVYLIMGGEWDVKVSATVNGITDTAHIAARSP